MWENAEVSLNRLVDVFLYTWNLGFTAFGGPPVHFQILHSRFVKGQDGKKNWVDEQTVQIVGGCCGGDKCRECVV